jgi:hypothetical protein
MSRIPGTPLLLVGVMVSFGFLGYGQETTKLAGVKAVYVHSLGEGNDAAMLREKLIAKIVNAGLWRVVDTPERADAEIMGRGMTRKIESALVLKGIATADTSYQSVLVVRLVDKQKNILWAYDSEEDRKGEGAVKNLLKAIEKENKAKGR